MFLNTIIFDSCMLYGKILYFDIILDANSVITCCEISLGTYCRNLCYENSEIIG